MTSQDLAVVRPHAAAPRLTKRRGRAIALTGLAAALGLAAVVNHRLARRAEARHPPRGAFIAVDGVRLHYLEKGTGPALVLLHGNGVSAEDFRASGLMDALAQSHRVIAFDRPGYGFSDRPRRKVWTARSQARLLLHALAVLGVQRPVVVGHSWGASVAANIALEAPEKIAGLVVMSGYYRATPRIDAPILGAPGVPVTGDVMRYTLSPPLARLLTPLVLRQLFSPAPVTERFNREYPMSLSRRPSQLQASGEESLLMGWEAVQLSRRLGELGVPTLILAGDEDKLISFSHQSEWLAERLAGSRFVPIEGAGHMLHHTATDEVATAIRDFAPSAARTS